MSVPLEKLSGSVSIAEPFAASNVELHPLFLGVKGKLVSHILEHPEHWRKRAEETRSIAEGFTDPDVRRMMLSVALAYDELAERAAERRELRQVLMEQPAEAPGPKS